METKFSGRCLCGAVTFEGSAEPAMAGNCHCRDCQRSSGSAFVTALFFPKNAVKITGEVRYFEVTGDSGSPFARGFCPRCGSNLFGLSPRFPDLIGLRAGTLDEPSRFAPTVNIFAASAPEWLVLDEDLPRFDRAPVR